MSQDELPLFAEPPDEHIARFVHLLALLGDWITSTQVCHHLVLPVNESSRRMIRDWANASDDVISGQRGYRHVTHATADDISHFCNWMESQASRMQSRSIRIRQRAHALVG